AIEGAAHAKLYGMKVVAPSGVAMCGRFASDHGHVPRRPYSFALSRARFDAILLRAAERAGAVIQEGEAVGEPRCVSRSGGGGVPAVALVVPGAAVRRRRQDFRAGFFAELERYPALAGRFERRRLVRDVLATGPFGQWARRPAVDGALLVGDAADFFDPFTGQGIYAALRGAELAADCLVPGLTSGAGAPISATMLEPYVRARRREFAGKWVL